MFFEFSVFCVFLEIKNWELKVFSLFFLFSLFLRTKNSFKNRNQTVPKLAWFLFLKLAPAWFLFLKLFMRTVFENKDNIILVISENCSYYLNLTFSVFFRTKKRNQTCSFFLSLFFKTNQVSKTVNKEALSYMFSISTTFY